MKLKTLLGVLSMIAVTPLHATEPLDSVYNSLKVNPSTTTTLVKYTGTFSQDCPGFMYHRGMGNGWTEGEKIQLAGVAPEMAESIFNIFDRSASEVGHVTVLKTDRACFDNNNMLGYACHYDEETGTMQFLRATVEDEITIPYDWFKRDFYDGSVERIQVQLPVAEWVAALAKLNTELKYNYVFYDRYKSRIDSAYKEIFPMMTRVSDNYEAYRLLERFIASCNDGHTCVFSSGVIEQPVSSPFTTRLIDGRVYIDNVESTALDATGIKRGWEIVEVNGVTARQYGDSILSPYVSSSTPQWTDYMVYDGNGFTRGHKGDTLHLELRNGKKNVHVAHIIGSGKKDMPSQSKGFNFSKIKGNVGLLRIPDFQSPTVTKLFDAVYDDILSTDALIIDIRGNGGGNSGFATYIAQHFSADSIATASWSSPLYCPAFASWGREPFKHESPSQKIAPIDDKELYLKPVVILIDRGTFSAAEDFAALFKGMKRATFVGSPTGGSTGNGVRVQLNPLVSANICSKHDTAPDGTEFVGIGIQPDIPVAETPATYFAKKPTPTTDPYISTALTTLKK